MLARAGVSGQELAAERTVHDDTCEKLEAVQISIKLTTLKIGKSKVQLARLWRMKFDKSSEHLAAQAGQLELTLEELEVEHAHAECVVEGRVPDDTPTDAAPCKPRRALLPGHLPRDEICTPHPMSTAAPPDGAGSRHSKSDATAAVADRRSNRVPGVPCSCLIGRTYESFARARLSRERSDGAWRHASAVAIRLRHAGGGHVPVKQLALMHAYQRDVG